MEIARGASGGGVFDLFADGSGTALGANRARGISRGRGGGPREETFSLRKRSSCAYSVTCSPYESWDAADYAVAPEVGESVCQAAFGKTCDEHRATFAPLPTIRSLVKREVFVSGGGE